MHIHPSSPNSDFTNNSLHSEEIAATKIQAGFRGYRVRKQLHHHNQPQGRNSTNGYRRHQRRTTAMTTPSEATNGTANGSINGSASATAHLRNTHNNGAGAEDSTVEDRCATKIQAGVRGFLVRKKQKIATDAATKIQAGFRGFKARKEAQKLKQK